MFKQYKRTRITQSGKITPSIAPSGNCSIYKSTRERVVWEMEAPSDELLTASMVLQISDDAPGCMGDFIFGDLFHDGNQI